MELPIEFMISGTGQLFLIRSHDFNYYLTKHGISTFASWDAFFDHRYEAENCLTTYLKRFKKNEVHYYNSY